MADDSQEDKTEAPTPQRLEKAREEGQVARSRELSTFLLLAGGVGGLWITAPTLIGALFRVARASLDFSPAVARDPARMMSQLLSQAFTVAEGLVPVLALLLIVAVVGPNLLGGWLLSAKAIKFDPMRLDPIKGLGKVFSIQAVVELGKAIAKTILVGSVAATFIYTHLSALITLMSSDSQGGIVTALRLVLDCCALMVLAFVVVVAIDVPFQIWNHQKKLRMTPKEIKDEHKENEGDPHIKARLRQQRNRLARQRMMAAVPKADVVVTNPTHYAIALVYDDKKMGAPRVVAKGMNEVAGRIRELAGEAQVPLLSAPPLARALYQHTELDSEIPAPLYAAVAEVLAWVYQLDRAHREGEAAPAPPRTIGVPAEFEVPGEMPA